MIIKHMDDKSAQISELERLANGTSGPLREKIEQELRAIRAGQKGEQESAYLIDFHYGNSDRMAVLHNVRFEIDNRVAQIDHLLIHRTLHVFVLETKHFHAGVKITEGGEFLQWNHFNKNFVGMPSPLAQNERHIAVLRDVFSQISMPRRFGVNLSPVFHSYILVDPKARIDRPKTFDTSRIIKADMLDAEIDKKFDQFGVRDALGMMTRHVSRDALEGITHQLAALHTPSIVDYERRFGASLTKETVSPLTCRHCGSPNLSIRYGRYGYFFTCLDCSETSSIQIGCGNPTHKEKIRKDGRNFYRECAHCKSSSIFFSNPE